MRRPFFLYFLLKYLTASNHNTATEPIVIQKANCENVRSSKLKSDRKNGIANNSTVKKMVIPIMLETKMFL